MTSSSCPQCGTTLSCECVTSGRTSQFYNLFATRDGLGAWLFAFTIFAIVSVATALFGFDLDFGGIRGWGAVP